jgi:hypothetical protein
MERDQPRMGKSGPMTHRRGAIWTERVLLGLILVSLVGTLNLLVAIHRRAAAERRETGPETPAVAKTAEPDPTSEPAPEPSAPVESPAIAQKPEPPPAPPEEDPTQKAIASLAAARAKEIEAAHAADQRASAMEDAHRSAVAESKRWKRREMLVRQQIAGINAQAEKLERDADALDAERDVLERERDSTKAALAKASKRPGFAVLPYKGPNGTWRRPIVIECTKGGANLQPRGPKFNALELSPRIHPRSSTFIRAIARELFHIHSADTPDGTPAVPYIVFLVRPDGIAPYYLARTCLEPLGIAFGYELVEQNLAINVPDFDDVTTWDGTVPLDMPLAPAPTTAPISRRLAQANPTNDQIRTALAGLPAGDQGSMIGAIDGAGGAHGRGGQGLASSDNSEPQDFVWPGRGRRADQNSGHAGGSGGLAIASSAGPGSGEHPGGSGSGFTAPAVNAEDVGTDAGASTGGQPLPGNGGGTGGPGSGGSGPGGSGGADSLLRVPSFEPAGDQSGRSASLGQAGLLSGRASKGGSAAGAQAPTFGLGQNINGSYTRGDDGSVGPGGLLPQSGGATSPAGDRSGLIESGLGAGQGNGGNAGTGDPASDAGSGARSAAGDPASDMAPNARSTGTAGGGTGPGQGSGQGRGFDWKDAAKDGPPPGGPETPESKPALGQAPSGADTGPRSTAAAALANVSAGGALNRSSPPANGELDPALKAYQAGQYSQDDIDRARNLSGLSKLVSPGLAEKLAGAASALGSPSGTPSRSTLANTPPPSLQPSGMPSSTSSNNNSSNNQSGGMPLGGNTQSSTLASPSSSISSFGQSTSSSTNSEDVNDLIMPPRRKETLPTGAIEARFEIVVVCRKNDVVLQPGSYRITGDVLRSMGQGPDCILAREIRALVRNRAIVDPLIHQKPAIRFLVEQQGAETFALARRQLLFSLPDWPVSLQVSGSQDSGIFSRNPW